MKHKKSAKKTEEPEIKMPENFRAIICDFVNDLTTTFPEFAESWSHWSSPELSEPDLVGLYKYMLSVFPERFFDIIYQNDEIFTTESTINTFFLPNVDFKQLFHCKGVSDKIQKTIWKYLQLILFTVINSVKNKASFGETMNLFEGIDEQELQTKLSDTIAEMSQFFMDMVGGNGDVAEEGGSSSSSGANKEFSVDDVDDNDDDTDDDDNEEEEGRKGEKKTAENPFEKMFDQMPNMDSFKKAFDFEKMKNEMPKPEELHEHLKGLFDGKIGKLAKEMAEEISHDIGGIFGEQDGEIRTTQDVLKKLMKDPQKMMSLVKTVGDKLNQKMSSGEISQEDLMKEATEMFGKMKGMDGSGKFQDVLKNMMKQMGGLGGMGGMEGLSSLAGLGGLGDFSKLGKNARVDMNAMNNRLKKQTMKEKMRERLEKRKQEAAAALLIQQQMAAQKQPASTSAPISNHFIEKTNDKQYVFKMNNEKQEKSFAKPAAVAAAEPEDLDKLMTDLGLTNDIVETPNANAKKANKKKNKK
jgi:hypothetical protein